MIDIASGQFSAATSRVNTASDRNRHSSESSTKGQNRDLIMLEPLLKAMLQVLKRDPICVPYVYHELSLIEYVFRQKMKKY